MSISTSHAGEELATVLFIRICILTKVFTYNLNLLCRRKDWKIVVVDAGCLIG